ncbi:hypothetical protein N7532_004202 [Penicillium argentinense]|uniref:Methyltransferase domain-containing protein n=1 Tax=Penicillium argentinense TaxID=1131581 RepID=A0A9W9FNY7_9EURO|nr:uncharacterized protein N7532_004202 [Penicillium argentinense]KAJ5103673.1 hypothetical protein N7532_004202 [Penicillium argentinense]
MNLKGLETIDHVLKSHLGTPQAEVEYRLERQYKVWQVNIGYLLHPKIPQRDGMRVADVGTGTGIWLRDLAAVLLDDCKLDGFDLSGAMFFNEKPPPPNVKFHQHNLLEPFPAELIGQYDVVNVCAMVVALSSDEWKPALCNLISLLRMNIDPIFVAALYGLFQENGLENCDERIYPLDDPAGRSELNKAVLDGIHNFMIAALDCRTFEWAKSIDQVLGMKKAAQQDLVNLNGWFSYNVFTL